MLYLILRTGFPPPIIGNESPGKYIEKWVVYGKIDDMEVFSAKELTVYSGAKVTTKDTGAYGMIVAQGYSSINDVEVESPGLIRYGDLTRDEFFVPHPTAVKRVTVENKGFEPLVILNFFWT